MTAPRAPILLSDSSISLLSKITNPFSWLVGQGGHLFGSVCNFREAPGWKGVGRWKQPLRPSQSGLCKHHGPWPQVLISPTSLFKPKMDGRSHHLCGSSNAKAGCSPGVVQFCEVCPSQSLVQSRRLLTHHG